jgi:hypothetical protein
MTTHETYFLTFARSLNAALALRGLADATVAQARKCYAIGLSVGEAVTVLSIAQPKRRAA